LISRRPFERRDTSVPCPSQLVLDPGGDGGQLVVGQVAHGADYTQVASELREFADKLEEQAAALGGGKRGRGKSG
jgi:hypothetical protein